MSVLSESTRQTGLVLRVSPTGAYVYGPGTHEHNIVNEPEKFAWSDVARVTLSLGEWGVVWVSDNDPASIKAKFVEMLAYQAVNHSDLDMFTKTLNNASVVAKHHGIAIGFDIDRAKRTKLFKQEVMTTLLTGVRDEDPSVVMQWVHNLRLGRFSWPELSTIEDGLERDAGLTEAKGNQKEFLDIEKDSSGYNINGYDPAQTRSLRKSLAIYNEAHPTRNFDGVYLTAFFGKTDSFGRVESASMTYSLEGKPTGNIYADINVAADGVMQTLALAKLADEYMKAIGKPPLYGNPLDSDVFKRSALRSLLREYMKEHRRRDAVAEVKKLKKMGCAWPELDMILSSAEANGRDKISEEVRPGDRVDIDLVDISRTKPRGKR